MKKIVLLLSLSISAISFGQSCCNVVDSEGLTVVDTNGHCITAPNLPSYSAKGCSEAVVAEVAPKPKPAPKPKKIVLNDSERIVLSQALEGVKFKTDSDVLLPESLPKLDAVAEIMKNHPDYKLTIDGYTDNTGSSQYNHELSYKRANAAKARLVVDGINGNRITTHGYGEERPIATNNTAEGRAQNRRIEFLVSY